MASTHKAVLVFSDSNGKEITQSYNYVKDPETFTQQMMTTLINAILTNGSIFATVPVVCKSAKIVTTTPTDYTVPSA